MTVSKVPETYPVEEIQEILQLAIARRDDDGELTRVQLEEIAADLGIAKTDLVAAELAWQDGKVELQKKREFNLIRRQALKNKVVRFSVVNTFFLSINTIGSGHPSWSLYVLSIWGLFFALRSWRLWQKSGMNYENAFQRWDRQTQLKESVQTIWQKVQKFVKSLE
ncbi:MAG: 2TM domain-containing protein [Limnothrix sp.]